MTGKENAPANAAPNAAALAITLRQLRQLADSTSDKHVVLDPAANRNLVPTLHAALAVPSLRPSLAHLLVHLSAHPQAAACLANPPFVAILDVLLRPPPDPAALTAAARTARNLTAHSADNATSLARHSSIVRNLVHHLRNPPPPIPVSHPAPPRPPPRNRHSDPTSLVKTDPPGPELAAALANVARAGAHCQAYAIKHAAIPALAEAAFSSSTATCFHAVRALSEFSLRPKWLVLLTAEGCVPSMLRLVHSCPDHDVLAEAVRFLGNIATSRVGREIVLGVSAMPVLLTRLRTLPRSAPPLLRADILRATANLCVDSSDAARELVAAEGVSPLLDAHAHQVEDVRNEAFRGLLVVAQAGPECRAAVLRDVGVRLRADASAGRCVAQLYDLARRIRIEASTAPADDFPQTIADLGAASKSLLFRAGPLASAMPTSHQPKPMPLQKTEPTQHRQPYAATPHPSEGTPVRGHRPAHGNAAAAHDSPAQTTSRPANSVPDLTPPPRRSARLLSVQRPVRHRERLQRDRARAQGQGRTPHTPQHQTPSVPRTPTSPVTRTSPNGADHPPRRTPQHPQRREVQRRPVSPDPPRFSDRGPARRPEKAADPRAVSEGRGQAAAAAAAAAASASAGAAASGPHQTTRLELEQIPRARIVQSGDRDRAADDGDSVGRWVRAVWGAVCGAVSGPGQGADSAASSAMTASTFGTPMRRDGRGSVGELGDTDSYDGDEDVYEMGVPLGRGGFATVFLAKNVRSGELVAVKRFHPPSASSPDARHKAETSLRRAMKEQRIWDGLQHKNIVSYKGCFFGEEGELNLVAEYVAGWSLADHLSQINKFPEHMVACITLQIVAGLEYLHECGVTHRDVKPANVLVDPEGVIKITDFGVSSAVDVPTMTGNTLVGTPWYIAPEMIEGRPYGKSVDIWSLGCTVLELATGRRPYHHLRPHIAMFRMTQDRRPPIPRSLGPRLRDFLRTCWVWDPAQRPTPAHLRRHPFLASLSRPEITNLKNMTRKV